MKPSFLVALFAFTPVAAHAITPAAIPKRGASLQALVPRGWKIEKHIAGDLNRDRVPDAALVLVENLPAKDAQGEVTARDRALVVALKSGSTWRRVGANTRLLQDTRAGGAFYGVVETPVDVQIENGVVVVSQDSGSREILETTHRFRFDARSNRMRLIGYDEVIRDRANGDVSSESINYLTGVRKTSQFPAGAKSTTQTMRVGRNTTLMESVGAR